MEVAANTETKSSRREHNSRQDKESKQSFEKLTIVLPITHISLLNLGDLEIDTLALMQIMQ